MTLTSKTRLGKRKLEINGTAPKTSSKSKAELLDELEEMHLLKELNEALLEEVKTNEETITNLKKKEKKSVEAIKNLEQKIEKQQSSKVSIQKDKQTAGTQTQYTDIMLCTECEFPADDLYDLGEHMGEYHTERNVCEYCSQSFDNQSSMAEHIMKKHSSEKGVKILDSENIYCNFCDEIFEDRNGLMKHKKLEHPDKVSKCVYYVTGTCNYGDIDCWFSHVTESMIP